MLIRIVRSTGFRYTALYALLFVASVVTLFLTIYWSVGKSLNEGIANQISVEVTALTASHDPGELAELAAAVNKLTASAGGERVYLLLDRTGSKIAGNLDPQQLRPGWQHLAVDAYGPHAALQDRDGDGDTSPHDVLAFGVVLPGASYLLVGADTEQVEDAEDATMTAFLWALVPTVILGCAGGALLSVSFLKRIDSITLASREIVSGELNRRIPVRGTGDEMDRLSSSLNDMLERIQLLMESLKQVSADVAHDLRTPLTHLRQRLESARARPQSAADYEAAVDHAIVQVDEILKTFSALIRIAQIESRTRRSAFAEQDLSDIFSHVAAAYAGVAAENGQRLSTLIDASIGFVGDRSLLTQMLSNLIENAIQHASRGARIEVSLALTGTGAIGVVADTGAGIPEGEREKVLRRFYRLDQSRSTPGNGLGLATVAAIAELHDIELKLGDNHPGLRVSLRFRSVCSVGESDTDTQTQSVRVLAHN